MGVYGIGLFFMRNFGNFDFNVRYCVIIRPCGMRYFIILADGIRGNMIVLGMAVSLRTADVFPVVANDRKYVCGSQAILRYGSLRFPFDTTRKTKHSKI